MRYAEIRQAITCHRETGQRVTVYLIDRTRGEYRVVSFTDEATAVAECERAGYVVAANDFEALP